MFKPVKSILFATNLSDSCKPALDFSISLAIRYQATLVLLHVIEKMPDYVEGRLKGLLGARQWDDISQAHEQSARDQLIGKRSRRGIIQSALEKYCDEIGVEADSCGYQSREVVLVDGEIVDEIIKQSRKFECDLIVMAARKGFLKDNRIGAHIKNVLRRSKIPVMVVPPSSEKAGE